MEMRSAARNCLVQRDDRRGRRGNPIYLAAFIRVDHGLKKPLCANAFGTMSVRGGGLFLVSRAPGFLDAFAVESEWRLSAVLGAAFSRHAAPIHGPIVAVGGPAAAGPRERRLKISVRGGRHRQRLATPPTDPAGVTRRSDLRVTAPCQQRAETSKKP